MKLYLLNGCSLSLFGDLENIYVYTFGTNDKKCHFFEEKKGLKNRFILL